MKGRKFYVWNFFLLLLTSIVSADDDNVMPTSNATNDNDPEQSENEEIIFSSPISDDISEPIGMPKPTKPKPHHPNKQKDHLENVQTHRKHVFEAVSQPCYSHSCRGGYDGNYPKWQPRGNRVVPYPQAPFNEGRRRGPYQSQDYYFDDYYMPRDPEYGYRQRGGGYGYPRGRYGGGDFGGYGQTGYGRRFLG